MSHGKVMQLPEGEEPTSQTMTRASKRRAGARGAGVSIKPGAQAPGSKTQSGSSARSGRQPVKMYGPLNFDCDGNFDSGWFVPYGNAA